VRFRFPGHEDLELVDSEVGPIPDGWAVRYLGDVCRRITDGAHASPPSTVLGKPMASVKDMTHLSLDLQTCRLISTEDFARLSQQDCKPLVGDVLVSKDGAKYLDKVFEVLVDRDVVVLSSIAVLRPGHAIRSSVLASMLKNADTKARLKRSVSGAAIPRVVLKDFAAFKNVLPPTDLQDQFDQTGGSLVRVAARLEELNRALASVRDLLLPRLVTGRLDVGDLDLGELLPSEPA
jgi:type I restriction enzyme S subunit